MLSQASTSRSSKSADGHMAFLRRVTEDDRFRAALEADPQAALAEFGLHVDPDQIPSKVTIPSGEGILDLLGSDSDSDDQDAYFPEWFGLLGS